VTPMNDPGSVSESERVVLTLVALVAVAAGAPLIAWRSAQRWLLEQQVLVAAADGPLITLPGGQAGLDGPRLLIGGGLLLALLAGLLLDVRRRRNEQERGPR
jgi:hypothetical protein